MRRNRELGWLNYKKSFNRQSTELSNYREVVVQLELVDSMDLVIELLLEVETGPVEIKEHLAIAG